MEKVEITLCIGLLGCCVLGIISDTDLVYDDICSYDMVSEWYNNLPTHEAPIEGIYTIFADVTADESLTYKITDVKHS